MARVLAQSMSMTRHETMRQPLSMRLIPCIHTRCNCSEPASEPACTALPAVQLHRLWRRQLVNTSASVYRSLAAADVVHIEARKPTSISSTRDGRHCSTVSVSKALDSVLRRPDINSNSARSPAAAPFMRCPGELRRRVHSERRACAAMASAPPPAARAHATCRILSLF